MAPTFSDPAYSLPGMHSSLPPKLFTSLRRYRDCLTRLEIRACWELCRLHNNIGFWVVWLPTAWSITMAYHAQPQMSATVAISRLCAYVPLCLGIKSLIMTIDDILDADIDGLVERTKERAIPRGAITLERAWLFFAAQVVIGLYLALTCLSPTALRVSMFAWPLYIIYPTCKRWMSFAPVPLGFMFKVGVFMGWCDLSIDGSVPWSMLAYVYIGACLWTITYETIYQHQDKVDDIKIGIHSPALFLQHHTIPVTTCTAIAFLCLLAYAGHLNNHGPAFYVGLVGAACVLLPRLLDTNIDSPNDCRNLFLDTPLVGKLILLGLVVDAVHHRLANGFPL